MKTSPYKNEKTMRGLKVVLFINFLLWASYGLVDLFFPDYLIKMNMGQSDTSARHVAAIVIGLAIIIWQCYRNPAKYVMVVYALIILNAIDLLVGIFQSINGTELWENTITGIVLNVVLGLGLVIFRPHSEMS